MEANMKNAESGFVHVECETEYDLKKETTIKVKLLGITLISAKIIV